MSVLTVGASQYQTIHAAIAASQDGGDLRSSGTYVNDVATVNHQINLVGVGGMVKMVANKPLASDKVFVVNNDVTIDHFEFWAQIASHSSAGIRYQSGT